MNEETFNIKLLIVCIVICLFILTCFCSFYQGHKLTNFRKKFHEKNIKCQQNLIIKQNQMMMSQFNTVNIEFH